MSMTAITWTVTPFDAASCEKVAGHHDERDSNHLDVTSFDAASCEKVAGHHDERDSDHLDRDSI